jgi:hypothetical protein
LSDGPNMVKLEDLDKVMAPLVWTWIFEFQNWQNSEEFR